MEDNQDVDKWLLQLIVAMLYLVGKTEIYEKAHQL